MAIQMLLSIALLTSIAGAAPVDVDEVAVNKCLAKEAGQAIVDAVGVFCLQSDLYVPSSSASRGAQRILDTDPYICIEGDCDPPQYIPENYCYNQLYEICASGTDYGSNYVRYDLNGANKNGCQRWAIFADPALIADLTPPSSDPTTTADSAPTQGVYCPNGGGCGYGDPPAAA